MEKEDLELMEATDKKIDDFKSQMLGSGINIDLSGEMIRRKEFQRQKAYIERYKMIYKKSEALVGQDNRAEITKVKEGSTISSMQVFERGLKKNQALLGLDDKSDAEVNLYVQEQEEMHKMLEKFRQLVLRLKNKNPKKFEEFVLTIMKNKIQFEQAIQEADERKPVIEIKF